MAVSDSKPLVLYRYDLDESLNQFTAATQEDYRLVFAKNDEEALRFLEINGRKVDALIVDQVDISGATNAALFNLAIANNPNCLTVILHDALTFKTLADLLDSRPISKCLPKPFDATLLRSNIYAAKLGALDITRTCSASKHRSSNVPKVLIVDDEPMAVKYLKKQLESLTDSFKVLTAENADQAMTLIDQHANDISVLITDQRMPGKTGNQLLHELLKTHPHIIRILTSAYKELDVALGAVNEGRIFSYLKKPWDANEILALIEKALSQYSARTEAISLSREKVSRQHQAIIASRVEALEHALSQVLTELNLPAASVSAFLLALEKITPLSPNASSIQASEEFGLEQDLVSQVASEFKRKIARLQFQTDEVAIQHFIFQVINQLAPQTGCDEANVHFDNSANNAQCASDFIEALRVMLKSSALKISDLDCVMIQGFWRITITGEAQLHCYQHLLSPLTRVTRPLVDQQTSLLLLFVICDIIGANIRLEGGKQATPFVIEMPCAQPITRIIQ